MPEPNNILICFAAVFTGAMLQGCLGFGFAFVSLPVFAMFFSPLQTTTTIVMLSLMLNFTVAITCFRKADKKVICWLLVGGVTGTPMGIGILKIVDAPSYSLLAGMVIMGAAGLFLLGKRYPLKDKMQNYLAVGLVSGVMNASLGLSGPPVVLFMNNQAYGKDVMRATMIGYFLMINISALLWFVSLRIITNDMFGFLQYFAPAVIFGTLTGIFVSRYIDEKFFQKMILVLVMMIGLVVSLKRFF